MTASFDLTGKVALVTGASRGIGESSARILAQYGAQVVVTSRKIDGCETVAEDIRNQGFKAVAHACHIGSPEQIDAVYAFIRSEFGRLDVLVNNAATNPYYGPIWETDVRAYDKTVEVNLRGTFFMSSRAVQLMKDNGDGSIINVASVNGVSPGDLQGIYSITKGAIINMTKAFAKECGPLGVRVNALLPGLTRTRFASALTDNPEVADAWTENIPLRRIGEPDEMAGAVLYLASAASSYATGSCLTVDGGYLA